MGNIRAIISSAVSDALNRTNAPGTNNPRTDAVENNKGVETGREDPKFSLLAF